VIGSLTVVGTGIAPAIQLTHQAEAVIRHADRVLYLVGDPSGRRRIRALAPSAEDLHGEYDPDRPRAESYARMTRRLIEPVEAGLHVCAVFYGHPGVCARPTRDALRAVRALGGRTRMLPAVSAHDALLADLELDPADGVQIFEATRWVTRAEHDPTVPLILYQVAAIGDTNFYRDRWPQVCVPVLLDVLRARYAPGHPCVLYTAATTPLWGPSVVETTIDGLAGVELESEHTLYVPPLARAPLDAAVIDRIEALRSAYYQRAGKPPAPPLADEETTP